MRGCGAGNFQGKRLARGRCKARIELHFRYPDANRLPRSRPDRRRPTLAAGAVARDAPPALTLRHSGRPKHHRCRLSRATARRKVLHLCLQYNARCKRTTLGRCTQPHLGKQRSRLVHSGRRPLSWQHQAPMRSIPPATCRHGRSTSRRLTQIKNRRHRRQARQNQHQA